MVRKACVSHYTRNLGHVAADTRTAAITIGLPFGRTSQLRQILMTLDALRVVEGIVIAYQLRVRRMAGYAGERFALLEAFAGLQSNRLKSGRVGLGRIAIIVKLIRLMATGTKSYTFTSSELFRLSQREV